MAEPTKTNEKTSAVAKPLYQLRNDFMTNLVQTANDCGLPFVVMEYVVRDFYDEVRRTAKKQYEIEQENYEKALSEAGAKHIASEKSSDGSDV